MWYGAAKSGLIPTRYTVVGTAGHTYFGFLVIKSTFCAGRGWEGREAAGCSKRNLTRPLWDPCWKCQASKIGLASISPKPCPLTRGAPPFQREPRRDLASCPFSRPLIRFVLQLTLHRKAWERVRFGRLGARQSNRLVISPSVALGSWRLQVSTISILGTPHGFCHLIVDILKLFFLPFCPHSTSWYSLISPQWGF